MGAPSHNPPSETPTCPGRAQRDRRIAELEGRIAEQETRIAKLEALARGPKRQAARREKNNIVVDGVSYRPSDSANCEPLVHKGLPFPPVFHFRPF
jgi:hypothetical protein